MRRTIPVVLSWMLFLAIFNLQSLASDATRLSPGEGLPTKVSDQIGQQGTISEEECLELIECSIQKYGNIYPLDAFFVLSIIKAESDFGKYEVSSSGAAGLAQLMPLTATEMGMKVFFPYYYQIAIDERKMAAEYYRKAEAAASKISFKNLSGENERLSFQIKLYREIGTWHEDQANSLFRHYEEELLSMVDGKTDEELMHIDQRFIVPLAIDACVKILANNAGKLNGDKREIASSYNAGLGAVISSGGIPFINQTVVFQNRVMRFYRKYLNDN